MSDVPPPPGLVLLRTTFPSPEYTILGKYENTNKTVEVEHNCGHKFNPRVSHIGRFNREIKCPECFSNFKKEETRKKNEKEFLSYFEYSTFDDEDPDVAGPSNPGGAPHKFVIRGKFINATTSVEVEYPCGHVNKPSLTNLKKGHTRCKKCSLKENAEKQKIPEKKAMEILKKRYPEPEYKIIGKYVKARDGIDVIHNTCGTLLRPCLSAVINNKEPTCPKCSRIEAGIKSRIHEDEVMPKIREVYPEPEYEIVGDYNGCSAPIAILHVTCGTINYPIPYNIIRGNSSTCRICNYKTNGQYLKEISQITIEDVQKKIDERTQGRIKITKFIDTHSDIECYCTLHQIHFTCSCGFIYNADSFGCPTCIEEKTQQHYKVKNEDYINTTSDILSDTNRPQHFFDDVKNRRLVIDKLGKKLGIDTLDDWYKITSREMFVKNNCVGILTKYNSSPTNTVMSLYPEHNWSVFKFKVRPQNLWKREGIYEECGEYIREELNIKKNNINEIYKINYQDIVKLKISRAIYFQNISFLDFFVKCFPQHKFEKIKFVRYKSELEVAEYLYDSGFQTIKHALWTKSEFVINPESGYKMPYDIVITVQNHIIFIEVDGDHHFEDMVCWKQTYEKNHKRDLFKQNEALLRGNSSFIRIYQRDINQRFDWKDELIDAINEIKIGEVKYISSCDKYKNW